MSAFSSALNGFVRLCDAVVCVDSLYKTFRKAPRAEEDATLQKISAISSTAIVGLASLEMICSLRGASSSTLGKIKVGESVVRIIDCPIRMAKAFNDEEFSVRFLENGVVAPFSDMIRTAAELDMYSEKHYLEMSPEERENTQRPIYGDPDEDGCREIIGYRPIDVKECEDNIKVDQRVIQVASVVKIVSSVGVVSNGTRLGAQLYSRLAEFVREKYLNFISQEHARLWPRGPEEPRHWLLDLPYIPEPLHDDVILSQYECPISYAPIRYVVGDPNGITLYEKKEILDWISTHGTSPMTQRPLRRADLVPKRGIQAKINARLIFHERRLEEYLESSPALMEALATVDHQAEQLGQN